MSDRMIEVPIALLWEIRKVVRQASEEYTFQIDFPDKEEFDETDLIESWHTKREAANNVEDQVGWILYQHENK